MWAPGCQGGNAEPSARARVSATTFSSSATTVRSTTVRISVGSVGAGSRGRRRVPLTAHMVVTATSARRNIAMLLSTRRRCSTIYRCAARAAGEVAR